MADIRIEKKSTAWIWWVLGLVVIALLLLWAFGAWDTETAEFGRVVNEPIRGVIAYAAMLE